MVSVTFAGSAIYDGYVYLFPGWQEQDEYNTIDFWRLHLDSITGDTNAEPIPWELVGVIKDELFWKYFDLDAYAFT
ncbi:MAG: hypothetical protein V2I33_16700 [Kangiellaceae bacterium]|jgi:hypothetical protein|nr:hypothetical protein [Kangiellaceae bacterium]